MEDWRSVPLGSNVASEVVRLLRDSPTDKELVLAPTSDLCSVLERYLPQLLRMRYPEWKGESLDGVRVARAIKTSPNALQLLGTCILVSDQSVAPLFAALEVTSAQDAIASFCVSLGEPGGGPLGISGPPCNSGQATRLQQHVTTRFDLGGIEWVYTVSSDGGPIRQDGDTSS